MATNCGCSAEWQKPKPNGTCETCGGWLPAVGQSGSIGIQPGGFFARLLAENDARDASREEKRR